MNGGNPPMFNMFGASGMPPMAQNSQSLPQRTKGSQQNGPNQVTPPNLPFMNSQGGMPQLQQQQIQGAGMFMNRATGGMPPLSVGQQPPNFSTTQGVPSNPLFLANAALMAAQNNPNMGPPNGQIPNVPQSQQMFMANTATVRMQGMPGAPGSMAAVAVNPIAQQQQANSFGRMSNNIKIKIPKKEIQEPHDHDVLCGRGGLTNYHRGNVWYRRLVKCNRPLYRESAKYTKLLVSKAIVQAVHSQNPPGRFIECDKESGHWYEIPYKKALDKTSQALRERDKDEEEGDGDLEGLNLTLVRIPLPEDASQDTQVAVNTPPAMRPGRRAAPKFRQLERMTPQQVMHQINMMKHAGMTPQQQANTLKAAGMSPEQINDVIMQASQQQQQQANPMMQMMGGPMQGQPNNAMMSGPNGMVQVPGQPTTMHGPGPAPAAMMMPGSAMMPGIAKQPQHSMKGPAVVAPSPEAYFQNFPAPIARLLENNPRIVSGAPACGAPTVLGPSGEPVMNVKKGPQMPPVPPSGMPRVLGPSGVPAQSATTAASGASSSKPATATAGPSASQPTTTAAKPASSTMVPAPGIMQGNFQLGMPSMPNAQHGMSVAPNMPNGTPFPGMMPQMMRQNGVGIMPNGGGMVPNATNMAVPGPQFPPGFKIDPTAPAASTPANAPSKKAEKSPTAALEGLAHIATVQAKVMASPGPRVPQQSNQPPSAHPSVSLQPSQPSMLPQQTNLPPMAQQPRPMQQQQPRPSIPPGVGTMIQPGQQARPPISHQQGIPLILQSPTSQQGTVRPQQMGMSQQPQQVGMMTHMQQQVTMPSQAGMKRQIYPVQAPPMNSGSGQQFKKQRVDNGATNEPTQSGDSQGGPTPSQVLQTNNEAVKNKLDQMTPEQIEQMAKHLMQISEMRKARENAEKAQLDAGGKEQYVVPSIVNPGMEPPALTRTEHSLGSIGSKSSIGTSSLSDGGPVDAAQVVDWIQNFHPVTKEGDKAPSTPGGEAPPPPSLEKSVSEALLSLATGPAKMLSELSALLDRNASGSSNGSSASLPQPPQPQGQRQQQQQQQRPQPPPPPPVELQKAATMVSVETQASSQKSAPSNVPVRRTSPQRIPATGSMIARQTNTSLPRRGTKQIPQKHLLNLQPRTKRGQKPILPLRPKPGGSIPKTLLPLKPRPPAINNGRVPAQLLPTAPPRRKSIQQEMAALVAAQAAASASNAAILPGAPPMLQLTRSASIRGGKVPQLNVSRRGETALQARVRKAAEKAQQEKESER